jgi:hypothetical protein
MSIGLYTENIFNHFVYINKDETGDLKFGSAQNKVQYNTTY